MNDTYRHSDPAASRRAAHIRAGWLTAELHAWWAALRCWQLYALLGLLAGGLLVVPQLPLHYGIDVGIGEGYGGDLPLLWGFNDAEQDAHGTYRWTADKAEIRLPGVGARPLLVRMHFFPIGGPILEQGPKVIEVWSQDTQIAALPIRPEGATYNLSIPAAVTSDGDLILTIRTATFAPGGNDPRRLGTPLDRIDVIGLSAGRLVAPNWGNTLAWMGATLLVWATMLRAGFRPMHALPMLAIAVLCAIVAAILDPPRFAFGASPVLTTALLGYGLLLVLRIALPWLARRFEIPLDERTLAWLLVIIIVAFGMRYGGRLFPDSMGGDIGFHYNRMTEVIKGRVFLLSRNRGVDFPYPPGPYLALAPFLTLGIDTRTLLEFGAAIVEGVSAALVYALVARAMVVSPRRHDAMTEQKNRDMDYRAGCSVPLLAAGLYVFTAAGFMTTWWSFDTHIYTQFVSLLLTTTVVLTAHWWTQPEANGPKKAHLAVIFLLLVGIFLGHFGFFINTVLLGGGLLALLWLLAWRGNRWARAGVWRFTLIYIGAGLAAALLFYSAFLPLFITQVQAAANGGLTGLAQRAPVPRSILWQTLWEAGFIIHFGFFPLLLAPVGLSIVWGRKTHDARRTTNAHSADLRRASCVVRPRLILVALVAGTFLVSSLFAVLPFLTQSTQSTRWLMFSAWAIAVMASVAARILWRCGRIGQLIVLAMGGYVLWNTLALWLGALAWRIRPPEPF